MVFAVVCSCQQTFCTWALDLAVSSPLGHFGGFLPTLANWHALAVSRLAPKLDGPQSRRHLPLPPPKTNSHSQTCHRAAWVPKCHFLEFGLFFYWALDAWLLKLEGGVGLASSLIKYSHHYTCQTASQKLLGKHILYIKKTTTTPPPLFF